MSFTDSTERRVAITGIGVATPIGCTKDALWQSLREGPSGIAKLRVAEDDTDSTDELPCAGEVRDFTGHIDEFGPLQPGLKKTIRKALKLMNRETQLALAAAQQALSDADLTAARLNPEQIGVCFGAGNVSILPRDFVAGIEACTNEHDEFEFQRWGTHGLDQVDPLWLLKCLPNMPACHIAIYNDFRGPNNSITQREAAANLAVAEAAHLIADGTAEAMISGGTGTTILPFNRLHALLEQEVVHGVDDPATACRPFDRRRCGLVIAEGAAAFVLESFDAALRRGATIYGEVLACGSSCVVNVNHVPRCDAALVNAIRSALHIAGLDPADVGHIHAHGLGTRVSDIEESRAILEALGESAERIPVVAAKSHTGHAGAGSGAIELAASLLAIQHGRLFPVLNYEERDPDCPVNVVTTPDVDAGETFLNLSVSPEGQASCLAVRKAA